jgi:hypothetical protein
VDAEQTDEAAVDEVNGPAKFVVVVLISACPLASMQTRVTYLIGGRSTRRDISGLSTLTWLVERRGGRAAAAQTSSLW